jgi:4-hydroxymandelate oxidase
MTLTRRQALGRVAAIPAQVAAGREARSVRLAPRDQLVNTLEYEEQAKRTLTADVFASIAGGDRAAFDRITLRPRMLSPALDLDLSVTLFGDTLFAPVMVGPIANQRQFHAEGELATVKGASAAKAAVVISSDASVPLSELMANATTPIWYQVFASDAGARARVHDAVKAGCKAICVTVGASPAAKATRRVAVPQRVDWTAVDAIRKGIDVPVLVKGIATPDDARLALKHDVQGLIVSNYGGLLGSVKDAPILALPAIVDAVQGNVPVLVDGSFRRGTDIVKALAFGARAVLVGRPAMWGLAAYGATGVQGVLETLQTDLARYMGMCGVSTVKALDRSVLRVHAPRDKTKSRLREFA